MGSPKQSEGTYARESDPWGEPNRLILIECD